jgi:hypothetical protein
VILNEKVVMSLLLAGTDLEEDDCAASNLENQAFSIVRRVDVSAFNRYVSQLATKHIE